MAQLLFVYQYYFVGGLVYQYLYISIIPYSKRRETVIVVAISFIFFEILYLVDQWNFEIIELEQAIFSKSGFAYDSAVVHTPDETRTTGESKTVLELSKLASRYQVIGEAWDEENVGEDHRVCDHGAAAENLQELPIAGLNKSVMFRFEVREELTVSSQVAGSARCNQPSRCVLVYFRCCSCCMMVADTGIRITVIFRFSVMDLSLNTFAC